MEPPPAKPRFAIADREARPRPRTARLGWMLLAVLAPCVLAGGLGLSETLLAAVAERYGIPARDRLLDWQALVETHRGRPEQVQLEVVNHFFNRLRFVEDPQHWGQRDYWATPIEMLASAGGDCEDFSIAKYFTLRELGVPTERVRITYVKSLELNQAHMVLAYYPKPDADPLILDNLTDAILPGSERPDLSPVYSFNGDGLWMAVERGRGRRVGRAHGLSAWRELTQRMREEQALGAPERPKTGAGTDG